MTKWNLIARHEYKKSIRRKEFLFTTLGLPLFLIIIVILSVLSMGSNMFQEQHDKIGYVDKIGIFKPGNFTEYADEEVAKKDLLNKKITHFFVIPTNYIANGEIILYSTKKINTDTRIENQIRSFLVYNMLKEEPMEIVERVRSPIHTRYLMLNENGVSSEEGFLSFIIPIAFGVLFMLSILTSSGFIIQGLIEEKENRMIEILLSSVSHRDILVGKILGLGAVGLTQILIWTATSVVILSSSPMVLAILFKNVHVSIPLLVVIFTYYVLGYLVFACIMAGTGAVSTSSQEGAPMGIIFSIVGALPFMFFQQIISNPNAVISRALSFFPLTSPITMIMRLFVTEVPPYEIVISILILAVSALIVIKLSVRIFRASLLIYGKKPTLKEVIKYVREN